MTTTYPSHQAPLPCYGFVFSALTGAVPWIFLLLPPMVAFVWLLPFVFSVLRLHNLELVQGLHEDGLHNPKCNTPSRMRSAIRSRPSLVTRGVLLHALLLPIERRYAAIACVRPLPTCNMLVSRIVSCALFVT